MAIVKALKTESVCCKILNIKTAQLIEIEGV